MLYILFNCSFSNIKKGLEENNNVSYLILIIK